MPIVASQKCQFIAETGERERERFAEDTKVHRYSLLFKEIIYSQHTYEIFQTHMTNESHAVCTLPIKCANETAQYIGIADDGWTEDHKLQTKGRKVEYEKSCLIE